MIEPLFIKKALEDQGFQVQYLHRKKTHMLDLHKFVVQVQNKPSQELVTLWESKHIGKKLFIETESGLERLGAEATAVLEQTIKEAMAMSPTNKLPHLFDPIQFISKNFEAEEEFDINEHKIQQQFDIATSNISQSHSMEELSYYGFTFPKNNHQSLVTTMFEKLHSVMGVEKKKHKYVVKFYPHGKSLVDEMKKLKLTKNALEDIGIKVDIESIYSVSAYFISLSIIKTFSVLSRSNNTSVAALAQEPGAVLKSFKLLSAIF